MARSDPEAAERPFVETDLAAVARDAVAGLAPVAEARGLDLGFAGATPVMVHGDPESLRVLLENLVDNAIRYTPSGGTIDVAVTAGGGTPTLTVADDGPGISTRRPPARLRSVLPARVPRRHRQRAGAGHRLPHCAAAWRDRGTGRGRARTRVDGHSAVRGRRESAAAGHGNGRGARLRTGRFQ
ncbi:MAG: sensor histidine kinase [Betaproteobacteria bacterium]|nr:sensor histidine kinase [Betaproteobacteria bacterium]